LLLGILFGGEWSVETSFQSESYGSSKTPKYQHQQTTMMKKYESEDGCPSHGVYVFQDVGVTFSSNFDNGNLAHVERTSIANNNNNNSNTNFDFRIWTAPDNMDTDFQSKTGFWYYFVVSGLPPGAQLRITIVNASNHGGLYRYDMVRLNIHQ
jgi:hypothetical protein